METTNDSQPPEKMNADQLRSDMDTIKNVLTETDKNRELHRIIIAAGNILCGFLMLLAVPVFVLVVSIVGVATPETQPGDPSPTIIVGTVMVALAVVIMILALAFLIAGWGVWKKKSWGAVLVVVTGILNLSNIPLGTIFGIYTIWAVAKGKLSTSI